MTNIPLFLYTTLSWRVAVYLILISYSVVKIIIAVSFFIIMIIFLNIIIASVIFIITTKPIKFKDVIVISIRYKTFQVKPFK